MNPPRVVLGTDDPDAAEQMRALYAPLYGYQDARSRIICMDPRSAEMTKYAANAYLATRITFINEMANLCEAVGANVEQIRLGIGMDPRIGLQFLHAGCGFGGSCFPKDVQAILKTAADYQFEMNVLAAVDRTNDTQKLVPFEKVRAHFKGDLTGRRVAVWGLAFKAETDDVRESSSNYIVDALLREGAEVTVFDPIAMESFGRLVTQEPVFAASALDALDGADALIVSTAWKQFIDADLNEIQSRLKGNLIVDGRNIWSTREIPAGIVYLGIGRGDLTRRG
jgi:UDPglucose 6-dehydrogenase